MKRVVAKHIGFHGLKGELKLYPLVDDINVFKTFSELEIAKKKYKLKACRFHKNNVLVLLDDISSLTEAENIFTTKNNLVEADLVEELAEGEFYLEELKGLDVYRESSSELLGKVLEISDTAQMQLHVSLVASKKILIVPYVDEFIREIDLENSRITIEIDDSFLELAQ